MKKELNKVAEELSATINSLCKAEQSFNRSSLMNLLSEIYNKPQKLTMPLRKIGILTVSKGIYTFRKQASPIFWRRFYDILICLEEGRQYRKAVKKSCMESIHAYCFYMNSTDGKEYTITVK